MTIVIQLSHRYLHLNSYFARMFESKILSKNHKISKFLVNMVRSRSNKHRNESKLKMSPNQSMRLAYLYLLRPTVNN